jgi:AcrR family transcriptional regulator
MVATILHSAPTNATMHSMPESASLREQKRWDTSHRITLCAQRLTDERGLDGFTMDELAEAADVSRRTLFNYFPGKIDAVLGAVPDIPPADLAAFHAGGPHGRLLDDLGSLGQALLAVKEPDREEVELARRVLTGTPRLLVAACERFEDVTEEFVALVVAREGEDFGVGRARLAVRILGSVFDAALLTFLEDDGRTVGDLFDEYLRDARSLLA